MSTVYFDKQVLNPHAQGTQAYTNWEQGFMEAANKYFKPQLQSEVDAIRADTWYAARKITDKVVGEIDFKDGDRCPFYEKYFNSINDYLSSLNLNSNDTGKEDNETKSANWRSENLSKQSAPEPSALPNKEWEIVSFVSIHGEVLTLDEKKWKYRSETSSISDMDFLLKHYSIHSVRRLSDNTVFVAQTINNGKTIEKFYNGWNGMEIHYTDGSASLLLEETFLPPPTPTQPVVEDKPDDIPYLSLNDVKNHFDRYCLPFVMNEFYEKAKQKLNK